MHDVYTTVVFHIDLFLQIFHLFLYIYMYTHVLVLKWVSLYQKLTMQFARLKFRQRLNSLGVERNLHRFLVKEIHQRFCSRARPHKSWIDVCLFDGEKKYDSLYGASKTAIIFWENLSKIGHLIMAWLLRLIDFRDSTKFRIWHEIIFCLMVLLVQKSGEKTTVWM